MVIAGLRPGAEDFSEEPVTEQVVTTAKVRLHSR
jgi:FixJ family two-component response regulator